LSIKPGLLNFREMRDHTKLRAFELADEIAMIIKSQIEMKSYGDSMWLLKTNNIHMKWHC